MKKYSIGLDLGINNVGWSILDNETNKIVKSGVRLFKTSDGASDRRLNRNVRRRMKRKDTRIKDILSLCKSIGFPNNNIIDEKLIEKRFFGITKKIEKQDIVNILAYMVSHRGYIPFGDEEVDLINLDGKLPCEYYYELYKNNKKIRNTTSIVKSVKNEENIREIKILLENQQKYYSEITKGYIESVIKIFKRKRQFWEGPGSTKSLTPYGRFKTISDVEEYELKKKSNPNYEKFIFEDLIGKCKYCLNENCAINANYYYEYYNFLNDMINISFKSLEEISKKDYIVKINDTYKLNLNAINAIKNEILNSKSVNIIKIIEKTIGTSFDNVTGYRIDKKYNPEFSTFNIYRSIKASAIKEEIDISWINNIDIYNKILVKFAIAPSIRDAINLVNGDVEIDYNFNIESINKLSKVFDTINNKIQYGNLSEKILKRAIPDMEKELLNFQQVKNKFDYEKESREYFQKYYNYHDKPVKIETINPKYVNDIIASPQVKKTLRQSIRIINAIIKDNNAFPYAIAIESTKEMNGNDKRKEIERTQKAQEKLRKEATDTIINNFGEKLINNTNIIKVMLFNEMNGHCAYCNKPINLNELVNFGLEIEHILPLSKSFDDSFDNKTISCKECNDKKSNRTPCEYLKSIGMYDEFKKRVELLKISDKKKMNLLYEGILDKYKIRFFNRNLRDTAYATTELINQINLFNYYIKELDENNNILTLSTPGQLTHKIRKDYELDKDRDDGKYHHAVDASICVSLINTPLGKTLLDSQNNNKFWINKQNDFFIEKSKMIEYLKLDENIDYLKSIKSDNDIHLSSEITKNPQGKLANANTYKIIEKEGQTYKIDQIDNIYNLDFKDKNITNKIEKLFDENNKELTLLCYDNNKTLFSLLKDIYYKYKIDDTNPFNNYCKENGLDGIKLNDKSPVVTKLRYYSIINDVYLLNKTNIKKKSNTKLGFDSLSQIYTEVYVDKDKNEFVFLPVYSISVDLKTSNVKENDEFYKVFYDKYLLNKNVEYITKLYNGDYIEVLKSNGNDVVEGYFQYFNKTNNKIILKNGGSLTKRDRSLKVYSFDVLGKKYLRLTKKLD